MTQSPPEGMPTDEDCLAKAGHEWVILKGTKLPDRAEKDLVTKADALRGIAMMRLAAEARTRDAEDRVRELEAHIAEQITHVQTRIKDGIEMGATVWRIALEDVARENRAALSPKAGS